MQYTDGFKARMVRRMAGPEGISATRLARETGVAQATLSRWLRQASTLEGMGKGNRKQAPSSGPRTWSWEKKLAVVAEASRLRDEELGAFLRREGLHEAQLTEWRAQVQAALAPKSQRGRKRSPEALENRALKRDLDRKNKALAEVTALLALSKKVQELWGDEGSEHSHEQRDLILGLVDRGRLCRSSPS